MCLPPPPQKIMNNNPPPNTGDGTDPKPVYINIDPNMLILQTTFLSRARPFAVVAALQLGYAVMSVMAKFAMNEGMSPHVFVAYRMAAATAVMAPFAFFLERKTRPPMTISLYSKIAVLSLFEPVLEQNLFYTGMKFTSAGFATALCNALPALTFLMAWMFRLERVELRRFASQAKVVGTLVSVGGAMVMTLVKGPVLPWTASVFHAHFDASSSSSSSHQQSLIKGAVLIVGGCLSWSSFAILQAYILRAYPSELSLTTLMTMNGMVQGTVLALIVEGTNPQVWVVKFDVRLAAAIYGGIISGVAYYASGVIVKKRGPVFISSFNPLHMVLAALLGSFILAEKISLGKGLGAAIILIGLYMVLWGKSKDLKVVTNMHPIECEAQIEISMYRRITDLSWDTDIGNYGSSGGLKKLGVDQDAS